jgi:hypothetical protein
MALQIPIGYTNLVYRFRSTGDQEEMVIAVGALNATAQSVDLQAQNAVTQATGTGDPFAPAAMASQYTFVGVTAYLMTTNGIIVGEALVDDVGTVGAAPLPSNCAILVTKTTGIGGRRNKGRMFVPPFSPPEGDVDHNGNITSGLTTLQTRYTQWYDGLVGADLDPVLFHNDPDDTPTAITGFLVSSKIATQRRRMR